MGQRFHEFYELKRRKLDDYMSRLYNDHLLVTYLLQSFRKAGIQTLGQILHSPVTGTRLCSTEVFEPNPQIYEEPRVTSGISLPYESDWRVRVSYSTQHISADTLRSRLHQGSSITVVAGVQGLVGQDVRLEPLVMGFPTFDHPNNEQFGLDLMWYGWEWFEVFPGDIDEFRKISDAPLPPAEEWQGSMAGVPEEFVKESLCKLLGDTPQKDWGGEFHDHFAASIHLSGERATAAFLLKGPARFAEMTPKHLGKNGDQIYRLAASPAQVLIVQHAHSIGDAVRATLRAFAVNPSAPRRYCFLDGRDTYRLLRAYDLLPKPIR